ncbi:hypothetical protein PENVUL_c030G06408 [Penicillium vulpinum]|uniref:Uncharacterized protein n=1 Tax=Penicillium vulpinum TaxID=29845 RepID=A0A1V6RSI7_9EURO|nr:hypothetical protein PENVUL_c030G06408 [Penicillium vulpinum]
MSSPEILRDLVAGESNATATPSSAIPDSSLQKKAQRDALVGLDEVIRTMILERTAIQNDIIQQRAVLDDQLARLSSADEHIQNLQTVWATMAAGFGFISKKK